MPGKEQHIAILLFVRSAYEEVREKSLFPEISYGNRLAWVQELNRHAYSIAQAAQFPVFTISGEMQQGSNFGERFQHALQQVFDKGYTEVIAIGNDCLHLQTKDILLAAKTLQKKSLVAGPARDGGAYLIGIQQALFEALDFVNLPWQQDTLLSYLLSNSLKLGFDYSLLASLSDANTSRDFLRVLNSLKFTPLKKQLLHLLGRRISRSYSYLSSFYNSFSIFILLWRGPPKVFPSYIL